MGHLGSLEGVAGEESREDGRPQGKVEAVRETHKVNVPATEGRMKGKSGEQSRDIKERWGGEIGEDGAKIRWGTGTGRAHLMLSPQMKFPLKLL